MDSVNASLLSWYDFRVVGLSILIAVFSSYAAFDVTGRVAAARNSSRWLWRAGGTIALAFGVWSMHYSGMLAYKLPIRVVYDWPTVVLSFLPALLGTAIAIYFVGVEKPGLLRIWLGGAANGCGIAALHYTSMASMRLAAVAHYAPGIVILSALIAIVGSGIAFQLAFRDRDYDAGIDWRKIAGAVIMGGGAISGMHYTAMAAVKFTPSAIQPDLSHAVNISLLGTVGIGIVTLLVQALAVSTSVADRRFNNQRDISARILQSQDDERRRIARHLHETVAQTLAALKMNLAKAARSQTIRDSSTQAAIAESISLADESMQEVRTLSYLLHPPLLEEAGLASALRWYVSGFQERSGIAVTLEVPAGLQRLPQEIETAVFRIVQETLTNIHRHAGSSTATIRLALDGRKLILEAEDQGRGMPPGALRGPLRGPERLGVGIAGMQERVQQLGGKIEIDSTERGTKVKVTLPLSTET